MDVSSDVWLLSVEMHVYYVHDIHWLLNILFPPLFCSDGETFISADDLRINLWNLEISNQSFNIVDVKPTNMEDLTGRTHGIPSGYYMILWILCQF